MGLKHKVTINVAKPDGCRDPVVKSGTMKLRSRIINFLFGEKVKIMVLTPGDSVETVEIREIREAAQK